MKETLLVNLYAGPGSGKSTGAAYIFAKLKMAGVDCLIFWIRMAYIMKSQMELRTDITELFRR